MLSATIFFGPAWAYGGIWADNSRNCYLPTIARMLPNTSCWSHLSLVYFQHLGLPVITLSDLQNITKLKQHHMILLYKRTSWVDRQTHAPQPFIPLKNLSLHIKFPISKSTSITFLYPWDKEEVVILRVDARKSKFWTYSYEKKLHLFSQNVCIHSCHLNSIPD